MGSSLILVGVEVDVHRRCLDSWSDELHTGWLVVDDADEGGGEARSVPRLPWGSPGSSAVGGGEEVAVDDDRRCVVHLEEDEADGGGPLLRSNEQGQQSATVADWEHPEAVEFGTFRVSEM